MILIFRPILLALALTALLVACTPAVLGGSPQIRDEGLQMSTDPFTGRVVCEQRVTDLSDPERRTFVARLDEQGVATFGIIRSNLEPNDIVYALPSFEGDALQVRFANGAVRGYPLGDWDVEFPSSLEGTYSQFYFFIVSPEFLGGLAAEVGEVLYRVVDSNTANRNDVEGVLTLDHLAPFIDFYKECLAP